MDSISKGVFMRGMLFALLCFLSSSSLAAEPRPPTSDSLGKEGLTVSWDGTKLAYRVDRPGALGGDVAVFDLERGATAVLTSSFKDPVYAEGDWAPTFTLDTCGWPRSTVPHGSGQRASRLGVLRSFPRSAPFLPASAP